MEKSYSVSFWIGEIEILIKSRIKIIKWLINKKEEAKNIV